jgi:hypothetical protein
MALRLLLGSWLWERRRRRRATLVACISISPRRKKKKKASTEWLMASIPHLLRILGHGA